MTIGAADTQTSGELPVDHLAETSEAKQIEGRSLGQIAWARLKKDRIAMVSAVVILVVILIAVLAPLVVKISGYGPDQFNRFGPNGEPLLDSAKGGLPAGGLWGSGMSSEHWLGIEPQNGRDVFARLVYGTRVSLLVALGGTVIAVILGTVVGMVSGYFRGWVDTVLGRLMDIMLSFPYLLFVMALTPVIADRAKSMFGIEDTNTLRMGVLMFVLGFFGWAYLARIVRGQTLSIREREFVEAARAVEVRDRRIIFRHILPNALSPIVVAASLIVGANIIAEAFVSFLGFGVDPTQPTWGNILANARTFIPQGNWWWPFFSGAAIILTVLAVNFVGDGLRDAFDPRSRA
jgi:peptide/nickel transport system permease protein